MTKYILTIGIVLLLGVSFWYLFGNNKEAEPVNTAPGTREENTLPPATSESPALTTTIWNATNIKGAPLLENTTITIQFDDSGNVSGFNSCNNFTSTYTVNGADLTFNPNMATTQMACDEEVMAQADEFNKTLLATTNYELGDGTLFLNQGDTTGLEFVGQTNSLSKTTWNVTGYNNGNEAVVSPIIDTTLTITFGDDGTISGTGGCNNYSGQYSLSGSAIEISDIASTFMACVEPEGVSEQETAFLAALQSATEWSIQGNILYLRNANDELAITAAK